MRWPWQSEKSEPEHLRAGRWGEQRAARMLKKKGYRILGERVRVGLKDELDLVARHRNVLVFVEVKTRGSEDFGRPLSTVDRSKRRVMSRAALRYMRKLRPRPEFFRFDVVEVVGREEEGDPVIRHIENAFTLARGLRVPW